MAGPRRRLLIYLAALALFLAGTLLAVFLAARLSCPADAAAAAAMRTEKLLALTFDDGPRRSTTSALLDKGFTRLMGTAEDIASGVLLARGDLTLSISLSGGTLNMLMTRAEEPTPTPLPEWLADW